MVKALRCYLCLLLVVTILLTFQACSRYNSKGGELISIQNYCNERGYCISSDTIWLEEQSTEKNIAIDFGTFNAELTLFNNGSFYISFLKHSEFSKNEIDNLVELVNIISQKSFEPKSIIDLMENKEYSKSVTGVNTAEVRIHIKIFDFWQNYTGEYREFKDGRHIIVLTGVI